LNPIVFLHIEEGLNQLGGIHPQQVPVFTLEDENPNVAQGLKRRPITALGSAGSRSHGP
jgi:hypothetical protein